MDNKNIEKSKDRLEVLKTIEELEKKGLFDVDAEKDPPTIPLNPEDIEYIKTKKTDKLKAKLATGLAKIYLNKMIKENKVIIKEVNGLENMKNIKTGAVVTCNHFNPFDVFTVEKVFRDAGQNKTKKLYKVIREGNYTNFPGFYGMLFRNCDTLPLSQNKRTMVKFLNAVDTILKNGDFVLIYPEQSLWWNYQKPKPLKLGAFKIATKANVPVIPIFITTKDTEFIGEDGFPIKEYYVNIDKPIYPDDKLEQKENAETMKNTNYGVWKKIYEDFYKIPLEYTTLKEELK